MIILGNLLDLAGPVFNLDRALATALAAAASAAELFIGINGHDQQSCDFGALKSLVGLESLID